MGKLEKEHPDNRDRTLFEIARELFFDSISLEKLKGLTEADKEKIKYFYSCLEQENEKECLSLLEENNIKMVA